MWTKTSSCVVPKMASTTGASARRSAGGASIDGAEFNITEMCVMGKDTIDAVNKEVKRKTVDHDLLRINFKNVDMDSPCHVRLGPSQRDAFGGGGPVTKGGGVLAYIDALFWLAETTQKATR